MGNDSPDVVTVVIAVRNGRPHVVEAVETALDQGSAVAEVIVVDDGSTDGTYECLLALSAARLRVVRNAGRGVSSARNTGAALARSAWLLFLDADDRLASDALAGLLTARSPRSIAVYGDYERIDAQGRVIGNRSVLRGRRRKPSGDILTDLVAGNFIINGGVLICACEPFLELGGFKENLSLCEDWHMWCRLASRGPISYVPKHVLDYRVHDASVMMTSQRRYEDFTPAVDAVFADPLVAGSIDRRGMGALRRRAELSLKTYCAQQAVRAGSPWEGARLTFAALRHSPRRAPWVLGRIAGALASL